MQLVKLGLGLATIPLFAVVVVSAGGLLHRAAAWPSAGRRRRAYERATTAARARPAAAPAAEALAYVAEVREADDAWPVDVRRLIARQDYEAGLDWVHDLERRLAAEFALVELVGAGAR